MHRRHDPTYYWATRRLPREVHAPTHALYAYVRVADEIVDGEGRAADPAQRRAALDAWQAELAAPQHPAARALVDAAHRHALPLDELETYMRSMRIDCGPVRMGSRDELDSYMDGSAGSVGRIMATVLGIPERHRADFGALGRAFQLANFIRDVREDLRLDRVYLPGVDVEDLRGPVTPPHVRTVIAEEIARARAMFAASAPATAAAPRRVRPGMRMAVAVYARVLDRVEAAGCDVMRRRTEPRPRDLAVAALQGLRP